MRIALPNWMGRISPVFDVAKELIVIDFEEDGSRHQTTQNLVDATLARRVGILVMLGVDTLICGAISQSLEIMLASAGVRVVPGNCGGVNDVLEAFLADHLRAKRRDDGI